MHRRRRPLATSCLPWTASSLLDASGDTQEHTRATLSPPQPLFVVPTKKPRRSRNPSRRRRAPTWRHHPYSLATVSFVSSVDDFVVSPNQSSSSPSESDASITENSPQPQHAVAKFSVHRSSPATPPRPLEPW